MPEHAQKPENRRRFFMLMRKTPSTTGPQWSVFRRRRFWFKPWTWLKRNRWDTIDPAATTPDQMAYVNYMKRRLPHLVDRIPSTTR